MTKVTLYRDGEEERVYICEGFRYAIKEKNYMLFITYPLRKKYWWHIVISNSKKKEIFYHAK